MTKKYEDFYNMFPFTEMQHDFRIIAGITATAINDSPMFRRGIANSIETTERNALDSKAFTDSKLCEYIFGTNNSVSIPKPRIDRMGESSTINENGKRVWYRRNDKGFLRRWIITTAPRQLKGEQLARTLGIPNNSIAIVDMDKGITKRFKQGPRSDFVLYICINNITVADSAPKTNPYTSKGKNIFSNEIGISCKALISNTTIEIPNNNELKMNYTITNELYGNPTIDRKTKQTWKPGTPDLPEIVINDAHMENNRSGVSDSIRTFGWALNRTPPNDVIFSFLQKRSGDAFQGWITKNIIKVGNVTELYYKKEGRFTQYVARNPIEAYINLGGDIFTITGDYPYLCFCIENGISVLFSEQNQFIYFKRWLWTN
jgi:hypothetical protein